MSSPSDDNGQYFEDDTTEMTIRRSSRERNPSVKALENLEQILLDKFWRKITEIKGLLKTARQSLMKNKFESMTLEQMSWQLRKSKADLSSSYDEMCERFSIPQEVRLAYDRCHEETDGILSQIIKAMTPSNKDSSDLQSRTSSVSSKRLELTAKAAALQAEQNAKSEEARLQAELNRLEAEEAIRQAQLEADRIVNQVKQEAEEQTRKIKIKLEMDHRRQELENRRLETEMQKTNAELKEWTRFEELDEDRYFYG